METYKFKTDEDIDVQTRTIIKEEVVPAIPETTKDTEFTLEQKENQLQSLKDQEVSVKEQIISLEAEIMKVKIALNIK